MTGPLRAFACVLGAALCCALAGCDEQESTDGRTVLRLQVSGEPEEIAVYESLATGYEEATPGVSVDVVGVADKTDHLARLSTSFAAGDPPDVFLVNFREFSQFATRGALEPVEPLLADRGVDLADYYEAPVEAFDYAGALQCMPQNVSSLVVYYNRRLFDEAGVPAPPDRWGWTEFRDTAAALSAGEVDGAGIEPSVIRMAPFVWSNGGEVVDDTERPTTFTLDEPEAYEAVEYVVSLARDGLMPTAEEVAAQDLETRFETGKLAMLLSSRVDTPRFREVRGLSWDVAPLPAADEPANILHSDAYCLSRPADDWSDQLGAAADFVAYATGRQGQTITALGGRTVPSLRSVATSPAFLDPLQEPRRAQVWLDAIPDLRRTPVLPTWPEIEDVAEEQLTRAYYDGAALDEVLATLDQEAEPLFAAGASQGSG